jgi:hypothetical protein
MQIFNKLLIFTLLYPPYICFANVRLAGMGNLKYVIKDYTNEFNLFDLVSNPSGIIEDDSGRTVVRGNYKHGIGDMWSYKTKDYNAEISGFYRNDKSSIGCILGYNYYTLFEDNGIDFQIPSAIIYLAKALGSFRGGIAFGGERWIERQEQDWEKLEDMLTMDLGISGYPFKINEDNWINLGISTGYRKNQYVSKEYSPGGTGITRKLGFQAICSFSEINKLVIFSNVNDYKVTHPSEDYLSFNSFSKNFHALYEHKIHSESTLYNLDCAAHLSYEDIWKGKIPDTAAHTYYRKLKFIFGIGCIKSNGSIYGVEFTHTRNDRNYTGYFDSHSSNYLRIGFEHPVTKGIFLRLGLEEDFYSLDFNTLRNLIPPDIYTLGIGHISNTVRIDVAYNYVYSPTGTQQTDHTISLLLTLFP